MVYYFLSTLNLIRLDLHYYANLQVQLETCTIRFEGKYLVWGNLLGQNTLKKIVALNPEEGRIRFEVDKG